MIAKRDDTILTRATWIAVTLQSILALGMIWRSSVIVEGRRYFVLFDDAMISLRYAQNLALGNGLVWNPGERVEGVTNLLWTLVLVPFHWLPLTSSQICLAVQLLGIPVLWACVWATARLAKTCRLLPETAICAVVLTAAHYNLIYFGVLGMETALLTLLLTIGLRQSAAAVRDRTGWLRSGPWYALAVLCRLDAVLVVGWAILVELICVRRERLRTAGSASLVAAVLAGQFAWRYSYYGDWLPNTYYLKATGWPLLERIGTGLEQALWIGMAFGLPLLLASATLFRLRRWHVLLVGAFAALLAYHVEVGGDAWPLNRFVIPASPALFVVAAQGLHLFYRAFCEQRTRANSMLYRTVGTFACLAALIGPHIDHMLLITPPQTTADNQMNLRMWRAIERVATPPARVAVIYAGVLPYYSGRTAVDFYGKCDPYIARLPAIPGVRKAGHNKFDFAWSLRTHQPDVMVHAYSPTEPTLSRNYHPVSVEIDGVPLLLLLRNDSMHVSGGQSLTPNEALKLYDNTLKDVLGR
jgi:hypothetical protein